MNTLIKNIRLIMPDAVLKGYGVVFSEGKITDIDLEENINLQLIDKIIDGEGQFLSPGFIDIHNHGNTGNDIMDSREETIDNIGQFHVKNGVTSYLGTIITSSYDNIIAAIKNIVNYKNKKSLSQLLGIHLEGPFFSVLKKGAQPEKYIKEPDIDIIKEFVELAKDKLKMVSIAPEAYGAIEVISYLKEKDITVAMAHSNATFDEAKRGINHGVTVATHLFNGMREFNHREPGIIGAALTDNRVYCEIIYDKIHLHDETVKIALKIKGADKIVLVSDAMRAAGLKDGQYELGGQKVIVNNGAARLENGGLAGSTLNLKNAVYNMVTMLNIPIQDAITMASLSPAKAIGVDNFKGSIEIGKDADMLLFDDNINISAVFINGNSVNF
ncbi:MULTISPECIES: N-acetylglucosamine-6-phosphate deacetylase [Clostridium]|uniref:N-acetylglucosamine-6-phosphate deacetylase n=1 Tax=Clostridium faecium TaxID=2762223 RepID=A0ABR8YR47_9CLOT|nr:MULTISPECIES: N-acetylglucosamine-6-phosphate deacetylase [Clostridium]MBD8046725.1 N-acetylglucosamine-6-phosphate deacetylase [Clostridium faecium]MDU1348240.1 N-acetylglucosamine-6-phosphate deacetylase [Clostridium argentinense]